MVNDLKLYQMESHRQVAVQCLMSEDVHSSEKASVKARVSGQHDVEREKTVAKRAEGGERQNLTVIPPVGL
ncbi:hypothetical protein Q7C36_019052 [Tachysurus vachellii]|uniref:Uncharacterized protein n=1 Tax=Tachysurus vachellii TaxID=175792 RepID=A0AA88LVS6_TACVA|nr:hypothetical protein Q7C36_019052 [Tachysurus vachellii]